MKKDRRPDKQWDSWCKPHHKQSNYYEPPTHLSTCPLVHSWDDPIHWTWLHVQWRHNESWFHPCSLSHSYFSIHSTHSSVLGRMWKNFVMEATKQQDVIHAFFEGTKKARMFFLSQPICLINHSIPSHARTCYSFPHLESIVTIEALSKINWYIPQAIWKWESKYGVEFMEGWGEVGCGRRTIVLAMFIKVKKVPCCIPRGKGAHLFIIDPNLSMDLNQVHMKLYVKRNLKCGANARKKNTTYETHSFSIKILQHPQWKGKEVQLLSYYLLLSSLKRSF